MKRTAYVLFAGLLVIGLNGCAVPAPRSHYNVNLTIETAAKSATTVGDCEPDLEPWSFVGGAKVWATVKGDNQYVYGLTKLDGGTRVGNQCVFHATLQISDPPDLSTFVYVAETSPIDDQPGTRSEIATQFNAPTRAEDSFCDLSVVLTIPRGDDLQDARAREHFASDCVGH